MQENPILVPSWIKAGCFIDLKDKQGEWRVAYILNVTKTQIRVRYDGFSSKFDENFSITSANIKPFRSVIRGYTGQTDATPPRQHYKFTQSYHKQSFERPLNEFIQQMYTKSEYEINQFIRGSHYTWTQYLMTVTYVNKNQFNLAYEYFLKHFELVILYLKEMTKCASFEAWINGRGQGQGKDEIIEGKKAFAESYYQIFDSVYAIMQGYPRLKTFFKYNQNYLNLFISGYNTHTQFISDYLIKINFIQIYQQSLNKLLQDKTSIINLSFITGIFRLFAAIQKTIKQKDKKKQLTQKVCQFILRQCQKMPDISVKEEEVWLEKIYSTSKMILLKYSWKLEFFAKFQIINMHSWKCMILSEKLERKVKAINHLKTFFTNVCSPLKKQAMMIASTKNIIEQQIRKLQIFNAIFIQNQHHQIIKKGCELASELYKQKSVGMDELEIVWKSCRHRLEAVRKVMYAFFEEIAKQMRAEQISLLTQWTFNEELSQEMDRVFFYNFFRRVIDAATPEKLDVIKLLFQFSELRLQDNRDEIRIFSELLTMKKSLKLGFLATTINKFIQMIPQQKTSDMKIFYINLTNDIFYECKDSNISIQAKSFNLIFNVLCQQLKTKPKPQQPPQKTNQTVQGCLKLLQNLQPTFDFQPQQFFQLWKLFNEQQNKELRQQIFLPWILQISNAAGLLKVQTYQINRCLEETKIKKDIFSKIFRNKNAFDFIDISMFEFQIYRRFLIEVNRDNGLLREETNYLSGITYIRVLDKVEAIQGLKELFQIFLNCRSENVVARMVAHLIKQLHLNYDTSKSQQANITRAKKMEQLLQRIQKHIVDGIKKSNTKLVKKFLYLLYDIAITVKQTQKMPEQYSSNISYNRAAKRKIKITKDEITKESELSNLMSIKTMKKLICQQYKLFPYNTKLYKAIFEYKKVNEDGTSYDDASASSARSDQVSSHSGATYQIKNVILEEIPNQVLYAPISCLMLPDKNAEIVVKEVHNVVYELIERFVNDKVSEQLLKVLAGPQTFEKDASELAYKILIEVSCSNSSALQIVNNLINQLKAKKKASEQSLGFGDESVNFRMYFCKNIIKLQAQQLKQFISAKNIYIIKPIFEQLPRQITQPLQIDLLLQILTITKKALTLLKPEQSILSRQSIIKCILNQLEYHVLLQQTQQFKKQDRTHVHLNQLTVLHQCLNILEILHDKKSQRFLEFVVQNQQFAKIMTLMFKTIHRNQFGDQFQKRLEDHMKRANKLDVTCEKIMFQVIFDSLYAQVIQNRKRKNMSFFKLIRCFVTVASSTAIQRLFGKHSLQTTPSFWQTCLQTIQKQSDTILQNQKQKQNKTLSGHLLILEALLRKNPKSINLVLCRTILYNCILYNKQETIDKVKCISRGSIYAALEVLLVMVQSQELYMRFIVSQLRKYQQTQYWRIADFWNVNLENQLKSPVGYVGLENPGCICYLNSFTQSLFMNEEFRSSVKNFIAVDPTKDYSLLHELRKLFYNLEYSNQKFLNPVPFTKAIKNAEDKPMIKIFQQMDIQEYSSILFDKIQKLLPKDQDFVKQIFGGTYSNDIISKECKHCSTREESFLSMQVDVKANLQQSLRTLVKGELLQGENAYYCQKCNKKVRALKRMSIKKLPNNLIICLKRFEYNFETDQKFKVNSCCEFPRQLNLQQFSQQFLSSEQELQQISKLEQEKQISKDQEKEKEKETEQFKLHKLPHQYFEYKLKGVIIHTGSSQSGHYYALLESNTEADKWLEFNDSSVTEFDIQNLADQAFGSDEPAYPKFKNAYMLIYQRKIKISPNPNPHAVTSPPLQPPLQLPKPQQSKILNQIQHRNTQIQTFHTLFTPQYQQFVTAIFLYSLRTNAEVYHQYKQLVKKEGILEMPQSENLLPHKLFNTDCIQEVVKLLLEYTLFIRARDVNVRVLGDFMREVEKQLDTSVFMGVADYFLHQLSQPVLVEELFVEVSFRDKLTLISHFVCEVVLNRLKRRNNNINDSSTVLVIRIAETFTSVMVKNNACINQLMYILRRIIQEHKQFIEYFEQMGIFRNIFELLAGIDTNNESRNNKIIGIRCEANEILKQKLRHYKLQDSSSIQIRVKNEEMEEDDDYIEAKFEIEGVRQTSKCVLKQESPQQAWSYFYFIYQHQNQIIRQYGLDSQSSVSEQQKENSANKSENKLVSRRDIFLTQFGKLKDFRIQQFINECQGSKAAASLALLLCQVGHENEKTTFRLLSIIKKGLNQLEAVKFRSYLILLYYMIHHQDSLLNTKIQTVFNVLLSALKANEKYFSETDIIQQWIMKIVMTSKPFAQMLVRTQQGIQLLNEIIDRVEVQKKPTAQLMKKQRNPTYERLNYQIHGLIVSAEYEDYEKLYLIKKSFFTKLFHEQAFSLQIQAQLKVLSVLQPNYEQLNTPVRIGTSMVYMFNKRWSRIFIKSNRFGLLKVSKLVKEAEKKLNEEGSSWKKKQGQHRMNVVEIQGKCIQIEQDYKLCSQQHFIWQTEERLRFINVIQKEEGNKNIVLSKQNNNSQSPGEKKPNKQHKQEQNSSISYQSSGSSV